MLIALHLTGWGLALGSAAGVLALGIGATAYLLGVRHAFDADHIAAIDNVARRLRGDGRSSASVGFWFSLGHSTVVVTVVGLVAFGVSAVVDSVQHEGAVRAAAGVWGTAVSLAFLLVFGLVNLVSLVRLLGGRPVGVPAGGVLHRLFGRIVRLVDRPHRMYPVGLLFALGLDTAGTVLLLVTAGAASPGLPWQLTAAVPLLFAAGMALGDTLDGVFMDRLYGWAVAAAERRRSALIVTTAVSVLAAATVIAIEGSAVLPASVVTRLLDGIDPERVGVGIAAVFVLIAIVVAVLARADRGPLPAGGPPLGPIEERN